jgi:hypothetical protein
MKRDKFPIVVSESGLHISVDDILTPKEGYQLIGAIKDALFDWCKLTGKRIDWESLT